MFQKIDKNCQGYLTKIEFNQLLQQFDIQLNDEELYHLISEIDKNLDGIISYDELYRSLITDALQI
jgi:Ca2+-binding EF-hand superfamily protein